jgi:hypothetical protein
MTKKLLYVSYNIVDSLPVDLKEKLNFNQNVDKKFWTGAQAFSHARYGPDYCPWKIENNNSILPSPDLDPWFSLSFKDATDQRSIEILNISKLLNKPIGVYWSGGIDSTVVLSALVKNYSPEQLSTVEVWLNHYSIMENPLFFNQVIKDKIKFSIVHDNGFHNNVVSSHVVCDGEPADKLWLVEIGLVFAREYGLSSLQQSISTGKDMFVKFMSRFMPVSHAQRWMEILESNIKKKRHIVNTIGDLFSWINFNFYITSHYYQRFSQSVGISSWHDFKNHYHPWYGTTNYQKWAWGVDAVTKNKLSSLTDYKLTAKKYIFDLTKDEFSLHFKTKMASNYRDMHKVSQHNNKDAVMIFDDGTFVDKTDPKLLNYVSQYLR